MTTQVSSVDTAHKKFSLLRSRGKGGTGMPSGGKKKGAKRLIVLLLVLALLGAAGFGLYRLFFAREERVAITGTTVFGALNEAIEGSGTTTPADSVSYSVSGKVLQWLVEAGQEVKAGDLLYVLDSSDVRDQIVEAEVELDSLYEQRDELRENMANQKVTAEFSGRVEGVQVEVGDKVQTNTMLATLVDDSWMKTTLYFSYIYQQAIRTGMKITLSVPDQMLTLDAIVDEVRYVDYVTPEGMKCFSVTVRVENPGSLTEGTEVTCWLKQGNEYAYAVDKAQLRFNDEMTITAGASGEIEQVRVVDYQRVTAGEEMFFIDASGYESQLETVQKQIDNYEEKIAELRQSIDTEYTRYSDIDGQVVSASYSTNRMTGDDVGTVTIYNQQSMQISINVDELDADYLHEGMDVYLYRTTSSRTVEYPATLTYLSLEATSGSSGVSTFAATITIDSEGELSSGVTVYYSIDTSDSGMGAQETVLAPLNALCTYDDGYYMLVQSQTRPEQTIDPASAGGTVTDYPAGYYAVPVEVGDYNGSYIQILSGVEQGTTVFLRYMNAAPSGGNITSDVGGEENQMGMFPGGMGTFPGGTGNFPGGTGNFPGGTGNFPSMGQMGGGMGQMGGGSGGNRNPMGQMGGMAGGRG